MRGTGGRMTKIKCASLGISGFCALLLMPSLALANSVDARRSLQRNPPKTTAECMSQWRGLMADPRPDSKGNGLPPDKMCENSRRLPADEGKCKMIYEEVLKAYTEAERSVKTLCDLVPQAYAARCDGQGTCQSGPSAFHEKYASALQTHNDNVRSLITKMDEMAHVGLNQSEKFANDLKELKGAMDPRLNTETARRHGGATVTDALRNHSGQDAEAVLRILQRARETSTISQSEIERSIKSPYIFESMQASAVALDQKRDLEQYSQSLAQQRTEAARVAATTQARSTDMSSVNGSGNGINLPSGMPAIPMAAAPAASGGDISVPSGSAYTPGAYASAGGIEAPAPGGGLRNSLAAGRVYGAGVGATSVGTSGTGSGSAGGVVASLAAETIGAGTAASSSPQTTAASRPGGSLRDSLRARLAARNGGGIGEGGEGAIASAGRRGGYATGPDGKPLVGAAELDPNDPNAGRMPPMAMQNSETEDAVKALVSDFENSMGGGAGRSPASESDISNAILASDTPSLFLRLKEVHVRCVKRGCVTQLHGKGKI
jgi:hypothetical protein